MAISKTDIRRWGGWLAIVVVFSIACAFLSNWQFNRRQEALSAMSQLAANYDAPPVDIYAVAGRDSFDKANEWRTVKLQGHYLALNSVLVRNRPLNGEPGFLQLVPFQLVTGEIIAVERGWLASDEKYLAPKSYPLPEGEDQVVVGHVRASEPTLGRSAPEGQLATINIDSLIKSQGIKDLAFKKIYVRMSTESVASQKAPKQLEKPQLDEGNHLSYALQWILFAIMAAAALVWGIKKERDAMAGKRNVSKRKSIGASDAEIEDGLLEG